MKKCFFVFVIILLLAVISPSAKAEQTYNDDFRNSVELKDSLLSEDTDLNDPQSIKKDLQFKNIFTYVWNQVCNYIYESVNVFSMGITLILFSILLDRLGDHFSNQTIRDTFGFITALAMALIIHQNLSECAHMLQAAIEDMTVFTSACIPSFSVVMIAAGEGGAATAFSGALVFLGEAGALISKSLLLPLVDVYLSVGICSAISDEYNFSVLAKNIRKFIVWIVGVGLIIFRLILRLQTSAVRAGDHITKKYIRSAIRTLIPIVGSSLSEGVEGLFAIASGIKTTFAVGGVLIVVSIMLPVLIRIGIFGFSWSICKWFADFMNESTVKNIAEILSNSFYLMLALGGVVALMGLFSFFGIMTQVA